MPREIVVTPVDGGSPRRFAKDTVELGRLAELDYPLTKHGNILSRHHTAVFFEDGDLYVKDMGSRTGTFLNGEKLGKEPVNILPEDVVQLGGEKGPGFRFAFEDVAATTPSKKVAAAKKDAGETPSKKTPAAEPPAEPVAKRGERKRLMGNSTLAVALDAVVQKERTRAKRLVGLTAGGSALAIVLVVLVAAGIHSRGVASLEAAHASELEKVKAEEKRLGDHIDALASELAHKDKDLEAAKGNEEKAAKLEREKAALQKRIAELQGELDAKKRGEALAALSGSYEISTTEVGAQGPGVFRLYPDGLVVRQVTGSDGFVRTRQGIATASGTKLEVTFDGPGDPRDLSGDWNVKGEGTGGRWSGTVAFERSEELWLGTFRLTTDAGESMRLEVVGRFAQATLTGERGLGNGTTETVPYQLSSTGAQLRGSWKGGSETLSRRRLPRGKETRASYACDGTKLSGTLATGEKDTGTRSKVAPADAPAEGKPGVREDPVPLYLAAVRDTRLLLEPREDAKVNSVEKEGRWFKVTQSVNQCWQVALKDSSGKAWTAFVLKSDLQPAHVRYKPVAGPVLSGEPSAGGATQHHLGVCYLISALMSIARAQPQAIRDMIREEKDGSVSVRFFQEKDHGRLEPFWYRIARTVVVDDRGTVLYASGSEGQNWCPLVVKAYASVHGGGFYGGIEGGLQSQIYERVLGRESVSDDLEPLALTELTYGLARTLKLSDADVKAILRFGDDKAAEAERATLLQRPGLRVSLEHADEVLPRLVACGLSPAGRAKLHDYYRTRCVGPLGSGKYPDAAKALFEAIRERLAHGSPVGLDTRAWGSGGNGRSAGENTQLVPGLASRHAYSVMATSEHDGLLWVKVANPWHQYSRRYEKQGDAWKVSATSDDELKPTPGDTGEFEVELSDVLRYFRQVEYVK